jgi:zinc transporter ZupT
MPASVRAVALANGHLSGGLVLAGAVLMAAATVLGAWLAMRRKGRQEVWLGAAAGALLVIALVHLVPDAWSAARAVRLWPLTVPLTATGSFLLCGLIARRGCECDSRGRDAWGKSAAGALAAHRFLEGSALAFGASLAVTAALTVHALAEGLAVGALLATQPRRLVGRWLTVMCASPVAGAALAGAYSFPAAAQPILLAVAAGVLSQAARISLGTARRTLTGGRMTAGTVAAVLGTAVAMFLVVHVAG